MAKRIGRPLIYKGTYRERNQQAVRAYRLRNIEYMRGRGNLFKLCFQTNEKWYADNVDYHKAKQRLRHLCMPEQRRMIEMAHRNPGLPVPDLTPSKDLDDKCLLAYLDGLRKLRAAFGRDPNTGRKLKVKRDDT